MATLKTVRRRIKTAKNISQITKAMEMVAASKMHRARAQVIASRPYAQNLLGVIGDLVGRVEPKLHPLLIAPKSRETASRKNLTLLISPDKGLCGGLLTNLRRELVLESPNTDFIVVGKRGQNLALQLGGNIKAAFPMGISQPRYEMVPPIIQLIIDEFTQGGYQGVFCLYTQYISAFVQQPTRRQLLPIFAEEVSGLVRRLEEPAPLSGVSAGEYLFEPGPDAVLEALLPHYLEMEIYQMILESYACEQVARMVAMRNATENALEIILELNLTYNKLRQAIITNEIADISTAILALQE